MVPSETPSIADTPRRPASRRADYRMFRTTATRWMDNDGLGHVNNVTYYSFFDSAITSWMVGRGFLTTGQGPMWMVVENGCRYFSEIAFPDMVTVGFRLGRLGTSSARWELGLFRGDSDCASAEGFFVHVHVDRQTRRPAPIPEDMRHAILTELHHGHRT